MFGPGQTIDVGEFSDMPRHVLERSQEVVYLLSNDMCIAYCNAAWDKFAMENDGARATRQHVLHRNLFDFIPEQLDNFYRELFAKVRKNNAPADFSFECSSVALERHFQMHVLPLRDGFAVINSLRLESAHTHKSEHPGPDYVSPQGIIVQCAGCRRTRRADESLHWDWVPEYLGHEHQTRISHGSCPVCMAFYWKVLK
jgi:hypothetical protein